MTSLTTLADDNGGREVKLLQKLQPKFGEPGFALNYEDAQALIDHIRHLRTSEQKADLEGLDFSFLRFTIEQHIALMPNIKVDELFDLENLIVQDAIMPQHQQGECVKWLNIPVNKSDNIPQGYCYLTLTDSALKLISDHMLSDAGSWYIEANIHEHETTIRARYDQIIGGRTLTIFTDDQKEQLFSAIQTSAATKTPSTALGQP